MTIIQAIFWLAVVLIVYTYVGYPMLMWVWASCRRRIDRTARIAPELSILVVAYNESDRIRRRIENLLSLDYPTDRVEIVIASDGSNDSTADQARTYRNCGIRAIEFSARRGKAAVLNTVMPMLRGEVVVLMDVRQRVDGNALCALIHHFADPETGAVSGELMFDEDDGNSEVGEGVGFYWRYEKFIRLNESRVDSAVGTTGALYAIRRSLFEPIPEETILDDVLIPMCIARKGYRVLFEPRARVYDRICVSSATEFGRKVRTIAGNFQLLFHQRWLLNPYKNRLWFQTVSHKFCRLLGPVCLVAVFTTNLALLDRSFYQLVFGLQAGFYASALAGHAFRKGAARNVFLNVPYSFCLLNWATVVGFYQFATGRQRVTWQTALW